MDAASSWSYFTWLYSYVSFLVNWFSSTCSFQVIFALLLLNRKSVGLPKHPFFKSNNHNKVKTNPFMISCQNTAATLSFAVVNAIKLAMHDKGENKCVTTWNFFPQQNMKQRRWQKGFTLLLFRHNIQEETRAIQRASCTTCNFRTKCIYMKL